MKQLLILIITITFFISCKKGTAPEYDPGIKGELSVEFDNVAGSSDLELNTGDYTNAAGEAFKVTKLKYYVSNFTLTRMDGTVYTVPQEACYFLVDESDESTHEPLLNIPEGEYKTLSFVVGVDAARSVMDAPGRTGVLDVIAEGADMYWGFNEGYTFFKIEGTSPASPSADHIFKYHIGGYGGSFAATLNNIKTITLDLTARGTAKIKNGKATNIHLMVDILKMFTGATDVRIATHPEVTTINDYSAVIAANYAAMFRHDHTEN